MNNLITSSVQMTSLEISELVESRHDKVKQSIERLVKREVIAQPPMGDVPFVDESGRNRRTSAYIFSGEQGKLDSYIVVAQLSPEFTARVVYRWQALESGEATPAYLVSQSSPKDRAKAREVKEAFNCFLSIAKMCKFDGNMAILSANQATQSFTGVNPLQLMGRVSLEAQDQEQLLIVSEIADRLCWATRTVNPRLTESELQTEYRDHNNRLCYELTEMGLGFGVYVDTSKKHGDGSPVRQIKWRASVVDFLRDHYQIKQDAA